MIRVTNEKIKEILDRCNGRFGWVQIHVDTEENYLLMPLADLIEFYWKSKCRSLYTNTLIQGLFTKSDTINSDAVSVGLQQSSQTDMPHNINIAHSADGG